MSQAKGQKRQAAWLRRAQQRGPLNALLWPISWVYRWLMALRHWLYACGLLKVHQMDVPVVVVGNVVVGGAGKTPCTIALVNHLQAQGWHPGVVSRGHGRDATDVTHVLADTPANEAGDEPLLIHRRTGAPVCVAAHRVDAARALRAAHPHVDVLVCDDGLQHLALARQLAIVVFDDRGVGNGWLLPAGPLREPWPRAVDFVLHAGPAPGGPAPQFALTRTLADHAVDAAGRQVPLAQLRGEPLHALAAIARPQDFFALLHAEGLRPIAEEALPDHYDFSSWQRPPDKRLRLICTEKDAVKLWPAHPDALAVPLRLSIAPAFFDALDVTLASLSSPPH